MDYHETFKEENEQMKERYELTLQRIAEMNQEETVAEP